MMSAFTSCFPVRIRIASCASTATPRTTSIKQRASSSVTKNLQNNTLNNSSSSDVKSKREFLIRIERYRYENKCDSTSKTGGLEKASTRCSKSEITKTVHFQRHGQGYHNLLYNVLNDAGKPVTDIYDRDPTKNPFVRPEIVDSPLTELGRQQCSKQKSKINSNGTMMHIQPSLIIASPLHRALQTALITFGDLHYAKCTTSVPIIAHEACREELGLMVCNKRRPLSESKREFPTVDFSLLEHEHDTLWNPNEREPGHEQSDRIYKFLVDFLRTREEQELALVGHSAWLFHMCNAVVDCKFEVEGDINRINNGDERDDREYLTSWFQTSEIRSFKMTFLNNTNSNVE